MPQLEREIVKARAARLRARAAERRSAWFETQIGSLQTVLMEKGGKGHTAAFAPVAMGGLVIANDLLEVRITGACPDHLIGVPA